MKIFRSLVSCAWRLVDSNVRDAADVCVLGWRRLFACASSRFTRARQLKVFNLVLKEAINCTGELVKLPGKTATCVHCLAMHERFIWLHRSDLKENSRNNFHSILN